MRALVFIGAGVVVLWVFAVVGTALLGHGMDRRSSHYAPFVPASVWDGPITACLVQLVRALRRPALWLSGLEYGARLLFGHDVVEEMSEHEVSELTRAAWEPIRLESSRATRGQSARRARKKNRINSTKEDQS